MTDTKIIKGKVKTVFTTSEPDKVLIQYEDKVTAGNGKKVDFPQGKGKVCMEISAFLFPLLEKNGIKTHYLAKFPERMMCGKSVDIIPIEVVVRNIAAGSICRQTTLKEGRVINWPLVEYFLKDDDKDDPLLTIDRINLMGYSKELSTLEYEARSINAILRSTFDRIGLTLVDFKLEFGYDTENNILLADELSPDGMRLWKDGKSFDKDLFRNGKGDIVEAYQHILNELKKTK